MTGGGALDGNVGSEVFLFRLHVLLLFYTDILMAELTFISFTFYSGIFFNLCSNGKLLKLIFV